MLCLNDDTWSCVKPFSQVNSWDWIRENICMPDGRPFDGDAYPWTRGICEAWDDPSVNTIALQFAARLGKTAIAQSLQVCGIANRPGPALFGSSTEGLAKQTAKKKLVPILRETDATRAWVPDDKDLLASRLDLSILTFYIAWSGSPTTLSDIDPLFSHANEIDKWTYDVSLEADRLALFLERGIERPDRKAILEGTPTVDGHSRVNRLLVNGWNCRFPVPCHHCGRYQVLRINEGKDPLDGGIWWERLPNGDHPTPTVAADTARYICSGCGKDIHDEYRRPMIRRGVWCARGQRVTKRGRLIGQRLNDGPLASFQLSRLYAPTFTFGDIARGWVESRGNIEEEQNFTNSWKGETHKPRSKYASWEDVAERTCGNYAMGEVWGDANFLTAGVDRQIDHIPFSLWCWNRFQAGRCILYGIAHSWDELFDRYLHVWYDHPVYGEILPSLVGIDCRDETDDVLEACDKYHQPKARVWPLMGMRTTVMGGRMYRQEGISQAKKNRGKKDLRGIQMIKINTGLTQSWLDNCIYRRRPGDPNSIAFPKEARGDQDLFEQMTNEYRNEKGVWGPVHEHTPVDFRDTVRYARVMAEVYSRGNWKQWLQPAAPLSATKRKLQMQEQPEPQQRQEDERPTEERRKPKWVRARKTRRRRDGAMHAR